MKRRTTITILLAFIALSFSLRAQSLAEAAKAAADARAKAAAEAGPTTTTKDTAPTTPPAAKVYTNKDVGGAAPEPTAAAAAKPSTSTTTTTSTASTPPAADGGKDEAYWKAKMRALQTTLDNDRAQLRAAIKLYDAAEAGARRSAIGYSKMVDAAAEMTRWSATVENDRRAIRDLEEDARRANVIPGWLRTP